MKKDLYSKLLLVAAMLCIPLLNSWAQIEIASAADLQKIGVDDDYPMGGNYVLTADIDLSGITDWVPIGMHTGHAFSGAGKTLTNFSGTLDGQGHAIKNLVYTFEGTYTGNFTTDELTGGIFGRIAGTIKNLELRNLTITGNCAGALAAALAVSTIENVSVIGCTINGGSEVGGLAGRTNNNKHIVNNCYVDQTTKIIGGTKVGGFIGSIGQAVGLVMTNCYMAASMKGTDSATVYGLVGDFVQATGDIDLNGIFVMAQAETGTTVEPFCPDGRIKEESSYYACSEYFPAVAPENAVALAQLKEEATYTEAGWDFNEIWFTEAGEFPTFQWQSNSTGINPAKTEQFWKVNSQNNRIELTALEPLFLSVHDMTGKKLFAAHVNSSVSILASKGIYILKLRSTEKETTQKILVR